jgi:hypothetical protein
MLPTGWFREIPFFILIVPVEGYSLMPSESDESFGLETSSSLVAILGKDSRLLSATKLCSRHGFNKKLLRSFTSFSLRL